MPPWTLKWSPGPAPEWKPWEDAAPKPWWHFQEVEGTYDLVPHADVNISSEFVEKNWDGLTTSELPDARYQFGYVDLEGV